MIEGAQPRADVLGVGVDCRGDELVFGLEVVVDVPDGDLGSLCDVGERRLLDALLVQDLACAADQPLALAERRSGAPGDVVIR
jgi:hypothetical protein